jgi:hypothetical protein
MRPTGSKRYARRMPDPSQPPLLEALRRASAQANLDVRPLSADGGALWGAHERALVRVRDAGSAAQRIAAVAARQRGAIEAVADRARTLSARGVELQAGAARLLDALDRLALVGLNAGLEGARLGEGEGRALALVSDEVRAQSSRGGDVAREIGASLSQLSADLGQLEAHIGQAQAVVAEVTQDAARAAGAAMDTETALVDIGERVKAATGSDPEALRAVAEASDRARALVTSLGALAGKVQRQALVGALLPLFEPLAKLLGPSEEQAHDDSEAD